MQYVVWLPKLKSTLASIPLFHLCVVATSALHYAEVSYGRAFSRIRIVYVGEYSYFQCLLLVPLSPRRQIECGFVIALVDNL